MTTGGDNGNVTYFAEDIVRNILQWLPLASCIARFRCVSRFWQVLLSDLNFIRKIIFSQTSDDEKSLQVLITGIRDFTGNSSLLYSVYSYETLRPITVELSTPMDDGEYPRVVGCCNGIFCLAHTKRASNGNYVHSIILWNPTTSETKIVPPGPRHPCHSSRIGMFLRAQRIGFGYDPKTNDYKVVHVLEFVEGSTNDDNIYDYDPAEFYHGPTPLIFTEVYSLRKGSWKPLNVDAYSLESSWMHYMVDHKTIDLRQQWDTSRNEKCYWFRCKQSEGVSAVISFDMSTEVFELITIPQPTGLTHHYVEEVYWDDPSDPCGNRRGYEIEKTSHHEGCWEVRSCFMLKKGVLLVTFSLLCSKCDISRLPNDETWVLLNYEDAKSWTKLYTWSQPDRTPPSDQLEVWKDGTYICARSDIMSVCDFETSETIRKGMEIEGTVGQFQAHVFTPTQVSMSKLVCYLGKNVYRAGTNNRGVSGLGCIIRDWNRQVVVAASKVEDVQWTPDIAEGRAILFGLQKALALNVAPLLIELDCKSLIDMIKENAEYRTELGSICSDIRELAEACDVRDWSFVFREANGAAHYLAHIFPSD